MTVLTYILIGLAAWTAVAMVAGLGIGAVLKQCAASDGLVPVPVQPPLRKSA